MIYLASPYSHPDPAVRQRRYEAVCAAAGEMMREGLHVYSPIAHSHPIAEMGHLPLDSDFYRPHNFHMLSLSERLVVLMLPGWTTSTGVREEIKEAKRLDIDVGYRVSRIDRSQYARLWPLYAS